MSFVHLHVHTHFSLLDGLGKIDEMIDKAKSFGMPALAITDHGTMYGVIEFYKKAKEAGIKPIIGVEAYVAPRKLTDKVAKIDGSPHHLILLAKNNKGYKNLMKLTSVAHLKGYYYKPRIDKDLLKKHTAGVIGASACLQGEIPKMILAGKMKKATELAKEYANMFEPNSFYLELQSHTEDKDQNQVNKSLIEISKKTGIPLIGTSDIHYVNKEDQEAHEILLCVQTQKTINDKDRMSLADFNLSLKSPDEMKAAFKNIPEAIENTGKIAKMCNVEIKMGEYIFPKFEIPGNKDAYDFLKQTCEKNLEKKYGVNPKKEIKERLNYELGIIKQTGFSSYMLMVADYTNYAQNKGILVNTRGSAAGSLVAYLLDITNVDPIEYNLLFERFLNPERISMPDVDLDISDKRREEVIRYVAKKYGQENVAQIITFGTMAAKNSIRDCARAMGLPYASADRLSKMIPLGMKLEEALEKVDELKREYAADPQTRKLIDLSKRLEGVARHASVHAAGVVISDKPLENYTPLQFSTRDPEAMTTQYEMHALEDIGLVKMDFLGLANLTIIEDTVKIAEKTQDIKIDPASLPIDDKKTYELLSRAETSGVFQLESEGMKKNLRELKPDNFRDIIAMVALYRPGPMDFIPDYIEGKHGRKKIEYLHPKLEPILKETYGVAVYQEQVLQIARDLCGFTLGEADILRKAIGKKIKELLLEQKKKWVEGAVKNKITKQVAEQLFKFVEPFARYGFNKGHATSYANVAYITAYLKAHFPSEFMAAWLRSEQGRDIDKVSYALKECERMKIKVLPPSINKSFTDFGVVKEKGDIIYGLAAIKNVGRGVAERIVEERQNGEYKSLEDFAERMGSEVINKKVIESLAKCGALDNYADRNAILAGVEEICKFAKIKEEEKGSSQINLFGENQEAELNSKITLPETAPVDKKIKLVWEKELLGLYISEHPLGDYKGIINQVAIPVSEVTEERENQKVTVGGILTRIQKITTKNGQPMVFANIDDGVETLEIVVFPRTYEETSEFWREDNVILVSGKVNFKDGSPKILADKVKEVAEQMDLDSFSYEDNENKNQKKLEKIGKKSKSKIKDLGQKEKILKIKLPKKSNKKNLLKIKEIISMFPGTYPIILSLPVNGKNKEVRLTDKINICPALIDNLSQIVSKNSIITN